MNFSTMSNRCNYDCEVKLDGEGFFGLRGFTLQCKDDELVENLKKNLKFGLVEHQKSFTITRINLECFTSYYFNVFFCCGVCIRYENANWEL